MALCRHGRRSISALIAATVVLSATIATRGAAVRLKLPTYPAPTRIVWLDQGSGDTGSAGLFSDPACLDRFGFIPTPKRTTNPGGLPVGLARTATVDPTNDHQIAPTDRDSATYMAAERAADIVLEDAREPLAVAA